MIIEAAAAWVLLRVSYSVMNTVSKTSLGRAAGDVAVRAADSTASTARELGDMVASAIAKKQIRGRLKEDLEFLEREHRTGGLDDEEYARRVALTIEQAGGSTVPSASDAKRRRAGVTEHGRWYRCTCGNQVLYTVDVCSRCGQTKDGFSPVL